MADDRPSDPWAAWRGRLASARRRRDDKSTDWLVNVRKRKGESRQAEATDRLTATAPRVIVNKDWPLTKAKIALLYSQTPEIRLSTEEEAAKQAVPAFAKALNETIRRSQVGAAIEEELADVVNAAGISAILTACEKRTEMRPLPLASPAVADPMAPPVMEDVPQVTDIRYPARRISPTSLLIPSDFTGSVYDHARWLGYEDGMPWATAVVEFGLTEDVKEQVLGTDRRVRAGTTLNDDDGAQFRDTEVVNFAELFYWRHHYHPEETSFTALQRLVFVEGLEEPVINEPYTGQQRLPDGRVVGVTHNPIHVLTVTYISDDCLPPSDSTISRPQVSELEDSRSQMAQQRKHSIPIRWFNPNLVSPNTRTLLEKGTFQGFVPIANGDRGIGEVARANFPQEKYELDAVIDREITDQWQVGPNQMGGYASGAKSAREAGIVERNFQSRISQERAKVEKHLVAIAEDIGALMALHGGAAIPPELIGSISYSIRVDSTVLMDAQQRIDQIDTFVNKWAQSGYLNPKPLIEEWAELIGIDPTKGVVVDPQPKPPEPVKVSVSKAEDLVNPLFIATLMRTGQAPGPDELAAAMKLLQAAQAAAAGLGVSLVPMQAADPNAPPAEVATPGIRNADWQEQPRINKRDEDGGA